MLKVRKSVFAEMRGVSPGRLSQWLKEGKIDGAAIIGTGQRALLGSELALAQLRERLAVDERFGLNGPLDQSRRHRSDGRHGRGPDQG
jgi:hypothetical protein